MVTESKKAPTVSKKHPLLFCCSCFLLILLGHISGGRTRTEGTFTGTLVNAGHLHRKVLVKKVLWVRRNSPSFAKLRQVRMKACALLWNLPDSEGLPWFSRKTREKKGKDLSLPTAGTSKWAFSSCAVSRTFSAIHLWGRSGRGHYRKFSAIFCEVSAPFPDAIKRFFSPLQISANFPQSFRKTFHKKNPSLTTP